MREICTEAFYECKKLREVIFVPGSKLKKIGQSCFWGTGIQSIVIPKDVTEIQEHTF